MSNPVTGYNQYLNELSLMSEGLADANGLHGHDSFLRDSDDKPLELGSAAVNAIAHALGSAHLAYDYSPSAAAALGYGRELNSYWRGSKTNPAWDTFKDLYNNQVGRNIAEYARKNNLQRDQIQDLILDALSSGKLIVTHQDRRIDPSFNGNPFNFSVPVGDAAPWTSPSTGFSDFARFLTRAPARSPNAPAGSIPQPVESSARDSNFPAAGRSGVRLAPEPQSSRSPPFPYADEYDRYQRQLNGDNAQAPMFDPTKPPPPFDPSNPYAPSASGSIDKWIRSLAGADADDPTQFVPPIFRPLYRR